MADGGILSGLASLAGNLVRFGGGKREVDPEGDPLEGADSDAYSNESRIIGDVQEILQAGRRIRRFHERWWELCWEYYEGRQWVKWENGSVIHLETEDKPRLVFNFLTHFAQTKLAHLTGARPRWVGLPKTQTEESRDAARVAEDVWQSYWRSLNMDAERIPTTTIWMLVTGNFLWKVCWDPYKGARIRVPGKRAKLDPETGAPILDESGAPVMEPEPLEIGDLAIEDVYPQQFVADPAATNIEDTQKCCYTTFRPLDEVKRIYGDAAKDLAPAEMSTQDATSMTRLTRPWGAGGARSAEKVEIHEAFFRPTERYKEGLRAVIAGAQGGAMKLLKAEPTPAGYDYIPFVHFRELRTRGFWGLSNFRLQLDQQKTLNFQVSRMEYNAERLRPHLMASIESGIATEDFDNDDKTIVFYNHPYKPDWSNPPSLNQQNFDLPSRTLGMMKELSGQSDVLAGGGGEERSGRQVAYRQAEAGKVLDLTARELEAGFTRAAQLSLPLLRTYVTEERIIAALGPNRTTEIIHFIGSSLEGVAGIICQAGSGLPTSKAQRIDMIMDMRDKEIISNDLALELMDVPDLDQVYRKNLQDRDNANEENYKLAALDPAMVAQELQKIEQQAAMVAAKETAMGGPPMPPPQPSHLLRQLLTELELDVRPFDDHAMHEERIKNGLLKTRKFAKMPRALRELATEHWQWHREYLFPPPVPGIPGATPSPGPGPVAGIPGELPPGVSPAAATAAGTKESGAELAQGLPPVPPVPPPTSANKR